MWDNDHAGQSGDVPFLRHFNLVKNGKNFYLVNSSHEQQDKLARKMGNKTFLGFECIIIIVFSCF